MRICIAALASDRIESHMRALKDYTAALINLKQLLEPLENLKLFAADMEQVKEAEAEIQEALASHAKALLLPHDGPLTAVATTKSTS